MSAAPSSPTAGGHAPIEIGDAFARLTPHAAPAGITPPRLWQRLAQIGTGHALYATFNWVFDNILYVYVVYTLGVLRGGALMMAASFVQCAVTLVVYQRMRIDWVGTGLLAEIRAKPTRTRVENALVWASNRHPGVIFTLLCVFQDPFITAAFFKQGSFERLSRRDWAIFVAAVLVSNLYWIFVASLIGQAVAVLWRFIAGFWS